jgi:hypothetical protein
MKKRGNEHALGIRFRLINSLGEKTYPRSPHHRNSHTLFAPTTTHQKNIPSKKPLHRPTSHNLRVSLFPFLYSIPFNRTFILHHFKFIAVTEVSIEIFAFITGEIGLRFKRQGGGREELDWGGHFVRNWVCEGRRIFWLKRGETG